MLSYWKNHKEEIFYGIGSNGKVGQVVIAGERVCYDGCDPVEEPLSTYPYLSVFIIDEKVEGKDGYYLLRDMKGNCIKHHDQFRGAYSPYLFDIQEWLNWSAEREQEKYSRKEKKIETLEGQRDLLKDILRSQGVRIIKESQAVELGLDISDKIFKNKK